MGCWIWNATEGYPCGGQTTRRTGRERYLLVVVLVVGGDGLAEGQRQLVLAVQLQREALRHAPRAPLQRALHLAAVREAHAQQALPRLRLLGQLLDGGDVAVLVEDLGALVAAHELAAVHAHCAPVLVGVGAARRVRRRVHGGRRRGALLRHHLGRGRGLAYVFDLALRNNVFLRRYIIFSTHIF